MYEIIKGAGVGLVITTIGHPLDTIKTCIQNNKKIKYSFKNLYKGISYPLYFSILFNSVLFSLNDKINKKIKNHYLSGFITGILLSPIMNYFELMKIRKQLNIKNNRIVPLRGLITCCIRESIGSSSYLGIYYTYNEKYNNPGLIGGIAGMSSWLFTYSIDTVKSRIQSGNYKTFKDAIKAGNLHNGLSFCLLRGFIVNSCGFYIYDKL